MTRELQLTNKREKYLQRIEKHLERAQNVYQDALHYFSDRDAEEFFPDDNITESIESVLRDIQDIRESL